MRRYRFFTFALLISAFVLINLRCERIVLPVDQSGEVEYLQGNTNAQIIIKLLDNHSFAPISGAVVMITGIDSVTTDSIGNAVFDSVVAGSYLVSCRKDGFESTFDYLVLSIDSNSNTVPVISQSTDVLYMAKKGAVVKGNLYYKNENRMYPVDGAVVECQIDNDALEFQRPIVSTTSKDGSYKFENLPEYSKYTISVQPIVEDNVSYKHATSFQVVGRAAGDTIRADNVIMQKYTDGLFVVMSHNLKTFTKTDSLKIEFSESVDRETVGPDSLYITAGLTTARILANQIWKDDDKTLMIAPFDGAWNASQTYTLVVKKIKSTSGKPLDNTELSSIAFSPVTKGNLGKVEHLRYHDADLADTIKANYNTTSITLIWSPLDNATTYQIYQKATGDSVWVLAGTETDTTTDISTLARFEDGKQMEFIILGRNTTSVSSFEDATVLTVKDERKPVINSSTTWSGFDNSAYSTADTISISVSTSYLPEPMDTTKNPSASIIEAGYVSGSTYYGDTTYTINPDKCSWKWTNERSGVMKVVVDASKNGAYDNLKIDFTSVTDLAGNKPDTTGGRGYVTVQLRN